MQILYIRALALCLVPVLSLGFSALIFSIALHCSSQKNRLFLLPAFIVTSVYSFTSAKYFWMFPSLFGLWSVSLPLYILHVISLLYLEKWPSPLLKTVTPAAEIGKRRWRLRFRATYKLWGNPQLLGTVSASAESQTLRHSRLVFFCRRIIKLPIYFCAYTYLMPWVLRQIIGDYFPEDLSSTQQTMFRRLHHITFRELLIRTFTATTWIFESVIFLDGANIILACFCVLIGLDNPEDWPALFGNVSSATSLRRFWSKFWHKLAVRPYGNCGKAIAKSVGLQQNTIEFKALVAFVIFGMSGATHSVASWQLGHIDWQLSFYWFCLNFLVCALEILLSSMVRTFAKSMNCSRGLKAVEDGWIGKCLGHAWVFGFFFWSTPKWKYPGMYRHAVGMEMWNSFISNMYVGDA